MLCWPYWEMGRSALLNKAILLQNTKNDLYGEEQETASQLNTQENDTRKKFKDHVDAVKLAFRDDEATHD